MVRPVEGGVEIQGATGATRRLILTPASQGLRFLDGHIVEVEGRSKPGAIRVDGWSVTEGRNGLPAWVGEIVQLDGRLGLLMAEAGVTYALDLPSSEDLAAYVGRELLVEGWIDVANGLHVSFYRPLYDEGGR